MRLGGGAGDGTVEGVLGIVAVAVECDAAGGSVAPHAPTRTHATAQVTTNRTATKLALARVRQERPHLRPSLCGIRDQELSSRGGLAPPDHPGSLPGRQ